MFDDTFNLQRFLTPLPSFPAEAYHPMISGPRNWWGGPLDVEGLALSSVKCFAHALSAFLPAKQTGQIKIDSSRVASSFSSLTNLRINGRKPVGFAELSGFFPVRDGWVRLHANYPHHRAALENVLGETDVERIRSALTGLTASDVERAVNSGGGIASAVRKPSEWLETDIGKRLSGTPWIDFSLDTISARQGVSAPKPTDSRDLPLKGVKVLDMTRVIAGPSASRLLGALGADILRIDPPDHPELQDHHIDTGFHKRSAVANLRDGNVRTQVHSLLAEADAVLLGYRLAGLRNLGFNPELLREKYPHLAVVSLDAWGRSTPYTLERGFDSIVQAGTGISHIYGFSGPNGWQPGSLPVQALDHATGMGMAAAALALISARGDGISDSAHLSLARTAMILLSSSGPPGHVEDLPETPLRKINSDYGIIEFSPPPITMVNSELNFTSPPVTYGSSTFTWESD